MLFKNKYRVESTRLKEWDYSNAGWYFVTMNSKGHRIWFGVVEDDKIILNDLGKRVEKYWSEIPEHFRGIELDEYVIMPNHLHGIIII
jgi:REP element-mobilizing transposase RayT